MRRIMMVAAAAVAANLLAVVPNDASAAPAADFLAARPSLAQAVQYWGPGQHDGGWERRQQWREWRRERDEACIAEAARREGWRIEQEREQRRAWRHQHGYDPRYERGW